MTGGPVPLVVPSSDGSETVFVDGWTENPDISGVRRKGVEGDPEVRRTPRSVGPGYYYRTNVSSVYGKDPVGTVVLGVSFFVAEGRWRNGEGD